MSVHKHSTRFGFHSIEQDIGLGSGVHPGLGELEELAQDPPGADDLSVPAIRCMEVLPP